MRNKTNKIVVIIASLIFIIITMIGCGDGSKKDMQTKNKTEKELVVPKETKQPEVKTIVSLTNKEARARMELFLKENRRKYKEMGDVEEIKLVGGDYSNDGALDYFFTVGFFAGGDFVTYHNFFFESDLDKIRELNVNIAGVNCYNIIYAKKISEGIITGVVDLWKATSSDKVATRSVKAEFSITGNKIKIDKKFVPKFKKAEVEIESELEKDIPEEEEYHNGDENQ